MSFAHLHVHSCFSMLDGAATPEDLCRRARELGMDSLALTDHNGLYGAVRFAEAARKQGIKPIFGTELTLTDGAHLVLLARSDEGWRNLCRILTRAHLDAPLHQPAGRLETVVEHQEGLFVLTGCRKGPLSRALEGGSFQAALRLAERLRGLFGPERLFVELQAFGEYREERATLWKLSNIAEQVGLRTVATNNVHQLAREDHRVQDVLTCIRLIQRVSQAHPDRYPSGERYLKSVEEMREALAPYPEALANTAFLAEQCNVSLEVAGWRLPRFEPLPCSLSLGESAGERGLPRSSGTEAEHGISSAGRLGSHQAAPGPPYAAPPKSMQSSPPSHLAGGEGRGGGGGEVGLAREGAASGAPTTTGGRAETGLTGRDAGATGSSPLSLGERAGERGLPRSSGTEAEHGIPSAGRLGSHQAAPGPPYAAPPKSMQSSSPSHRAGGEGRGGGGGEVGFDPMAHLRRLTLEGLDRRLGPKTTPAYIQRRKEELDLIEEMGFADYFLICHDIVREARSHGIRTTGRGSVGDSLVAYSLDIVAPDPLEHGMIFQRFMNRERKGLPDIDIDFCSRRRDEVLAYVYERYGADHVAAVATLNTFRARSSVREVAKAMGYSPEEIDDIARVFPFLSTRDLRGSLTRSPETANCRVALDAVLEVISIAERITGFPRHLGIHVGGIIITDRPLTDYVPLQQSAKGIVICQYDKDDVEKLGLVKLDLLGLRIHSAVERCLDLVERRTGTRPDIDRVSLDDRATYRTMQEARTVGCFQLESPGERSLQQRLLPSRFSDVIANISLFRPGPVQGDMITPFVERRRGREPVNCLHPNLETVLRDTYGVILYQEQVIQTIHAMTGLTLDESDALRRAMTRDNASDVYQAIERRFLEGAAARGLSPEEAEQIFSQVTAFAAYGFCKGHAACFGLIAYQTAYLKTHHPAEFLAGVLSNEPMGYYSSRTILEEAKRSGVPILPLDVNASEPQFTVEALPARPIPGGTGVPACAGTPLTTPPTPGLRIALMQLAGLAERDQEAIVAGRADGPYASLLDFCQRVRIAEDSLGRLILAGAFDRLPAFRPEPEPEWWEYPSGVGPTHPPVLVRSDARLHRRRLLWMLPFLIRSCGWSLGEQRKLPAPDVDLVEREKEIRRRLCEDGLDQPESPAALERELLTLDHDLLHLSALRHPMAFARARLRREGYLSSSDIREQETGQWVRTGGVVVSRNRPPTKSGRTVVFVTLEDELGLFDAVVFERAYQRWRGTIFGYDTLRVEGRVERVSGGAASIIVQAAYPLHPVELPTDLPLMPGPGDHSGAHTRAVPPPSPRETLAQLDS